MKLPNKIETFFELVKWIESKKPKIIEIRKGSKMKKIREFNNQKIQENWAWKTFRGIPIKYLKK